MQRVPPVAQAATRRGWVARRTPLPGPPECEGEAALGSVLLARRGSGQLRSRVGHVRGGRQKSSPSGDRVEVSRSNSSVLDHDSSVSCMNNERASRRAR